VPPEAAPVARAAAQVAVPGAELVARVAARGAEPEVAPVALAAWAPAPAEGPAAAPVAPAVAPEAVLAVPVEAHRDHVRGAHDALRDRCRHAARPAAVPVARVVEPGAAPAVWAEAPRSQVRLLPDHAHGLRGDRRGHCRRSAQLAAVPPEAAPVAQVEGQGAALAARAEGRQRRLRRDHGRGLRDACHDRRRRFARQGQAARLGAGLAGRAEDRPGPAQPR